jgi:hypothetical protein
LHKWKRLDKEGDRWERDLFVLRGKRQKKHKNIWWRDCLKKTKNSERDDARGADRAKKTWGTGRERRFKKITAV